MRVGVVPEEERLAGVLGLLHEADRILDQILVEGGHVVFGVANPLALAAIRRASGVGRRKRAFVDDLLLADFAPTRIDGRVVGVARPAMHADCAVRLRCGRRIRWIRVPVRIRHGVEVIQIAEELIEAVHAGQIFVQVAEMVLAELTGGVAHRLERGGDGRRLCRQADIGACLTHGGQSGADRQFACDEIRATGGAARFSIVVGEAHSFRREPVEIRRLSRHDALMIGANIEPTNIVAHNEEDVRLLLRLSACGIDCG